MEPRARVPRPASITFVGEGEVRARVHASSYREAERFETVHAKITLVRSWWNGAEILFGAFFLAMFVAGSVLMTSQGGGDDLVSTVIVGSCWAMNAGFAYMVVAMAMNRSEIVIDDGVLRVRHVPLPWKREIVIDVRTIAHVGVRRRETHNSRDRPMYSLVAIVGGRDVALLTLLPTQQEALYLEQAIEDQLDIVDDRNTGEV